MTVASKSNEGRVLSHTKEYAPASVIGTTTHWKKNRQL